MSTDESACPNQTTIGLVPAAAAVASAPLVPGYEMLRELGRGGGGVVYLARQHRPSRLVAIKMLRPGAEAHLHASARLEREAEAIARLQHPGIIRVLSVGDCDGAPYLVLEFAEGGSLAACLNGTPLPPTRAAEAVLQMAAAVEAAHQAGIVHRDLKPANVLLETASENPETWRLKISDFGIAKWADTAELTATGHAVGTPCYMAPEQVSGQSEVGPATDVYALGAILYELLCGRPLFRAPSAMDVLHQVLWDDPLPPRVLQPGTPRDLETICLMCLRKNPRRRYASAQLLADDLQRYLVQRPIWARRIGPVERAAKWSRRHPAAALSFVFVTAMLAGLIAFTLRLRESERLTREEEASARQVVYDYCTRISENRLLREPGMEELRKELLGQAIGYLEQFAVRQQNRREARGELAKAYLRLGALAVDFGDASAGTRLVEQGCQMFRELAAENPSNDHLSRAFAESLLTAAEAFRVGQDEARATRLLHEARGVWKRAASQDPTAHSAAGWARTCELSAEMHLYRHEFAQALKATDEARPARQSAAAANPDDAQARWALAALDLLTARAAQAVGDYPAAEKHLRAALSSWEVIDGGALTLGPTQRADQAEGWHCLGAVLLERGHPGDAAAAFRTAIELGRELVRDYAATPAFHAELAGCLTDLARLHLRQEKGYEAEPLAKEAERSLRLLVQRHPNVVAYQVASLQSRTLLLPYYAETGRGAAVESLAEEILGEWSSLAARYPNRFEVQLGRADALRAIGEAVLVWSRQESANRWSQAEDLFADARMRYVQLPACEQEWLAALGICQADFGIAKTRFWGGSREEAIASLRHAAEGFERAITRYPQAAQSAADLAECFELWAEIADGDSPRSLARKAAEQREQLALAFPHVVRFQHERARARNRLGNRLWDAGDRAESLQEYRQAIALRQELLATMPRDEREAHGDAIVRWEVTRSLFDLRDAFLELGLTVEAKTALDDALRNQEELARDYPDAPAYQDGWAECYYQLAQWERRAGRIREAEATHHRAIAIREPLWATNRNDAQIGMNLCADYVALSRIALIDRRWEAAADWASRAVAVDEVLPQRPYDERYRLPIVRSALRLLGAASARTGHFDKAMTHWSRLAQLDDRWHPDYRLLCERGYRRLAQWLALLDALIEE